MGTPDADALPLMYTELAEWWPVLSDPANYAEEAAIYHHALEAVGTPPLETLLELGSGGGCNASHLKAWYRMTLVDLAPGMVEASRLLNPELEHHVGDMRDVRLGWTFDAVFIHDAISYMTTEEDLAAALRTAAAHCRPGGVALFVPDDVKETWQPSTDHGGYDREGRSLRYLEWMDDPDPDDTWTRTSFAYLIRDGDAPLRCVHEEHRTGLFPRETWRRLIADAGFVPETLPYRHSTFPPDAKRELFLGIRREA